MYLFSRQVTLQGPFPEVMAWATEITAFVNEHGTIPVSLWMGNAGVPLGTLTWSSRIDSHAQLQQSMEQIQSNDAYWDLVAKAQDWATTPGEDMLRQFITEPAGEVPNVAVITTATAANGRGADVMEWGIEIANYVGQLTGHQVAFLQDAYGTFGQVTWIQGLDDMAQVDAVADQTTADEEYLNKIVKAGDLFVAGTGQRMLASRLA